MDIKISLSKTYKNQYSQKRNRWITMDIPVHLIKNIKLQNFLLYDKESVDLPPGITLLTGKNGSGKSLFLDAVRLVFGLKSRTIRMERLTDYLRDKERPAVIEITLNNPERMPDVDPDKRILESSDIDFNKRFLSEDIVRVRRLITPRGETVFKMFDLTKQKFVTLDSAAMRGNLMEAYRKIGINPEDELAFVPAEEFLSFIQSSPEKRFEIFKEKLGVTLAEEKLKQTRRNLDGKEKEFLELKELLMQQRERLASLEDVHNKWLMKKEKEEELRKLEEELEWAKVKGVETEIRSEEESINRMEKQLEDLRTQYDEKIVESEDVEKELKEKEAEYNNRKKEYEKLKSIKAQIDYRYNELTRREEQNSTKISRLTQEIARLEGEKKRIRAEIDDLSKIDPDEIMEKYNKQIEEYEKQKKNLEIRIANLDKRIRELRAELTEKVNDEREAIRERIAEIERILVERRRKRYEKKAGDRKLQKMETYREFLEELRGRGLGGKVMGPFFAEVSPAPGMDKWKKAASVALSSIIGDFVTTDPDVFAKMIDIRSRNRRFYRIGLGLIEPDNLPERIYIREKADDIRRESGADAEYVYNVITGPRELIAYARIRSGGEMVLIDERNKVAVQKLAKKFRHKRFCTIDGEIIDYKQGSTRAAPKVDIDNIILIGSEIGEIAEDTGDLIKEKDELERKLRMLSPVRMLNNNGEYLQLNDERSKLTKRIGYLEGKIDELIKERDSKSPEKLIAEKTRKIEEIDKKIMMKRGQMEQLRQEIEADKETINELREKIAKIDEKYFDTEDKYNAAREEYNLIKNKRENIEKELTNLNRSIDNVERSIKKHRENLDALKEKLEELRKEFAGKPRPEKIRPPVTVKELIKLVTAEIRRIGVTEEEIEEYKAIKRNIENLENKIAEYEEGIRKLREEIERWEKKVSDTMSEKIEKIGEIFNDILKTIGAEGKIIREGNRLDILVKFPNEGFRPIDQHSSGQKQAGIIALVLALQSQSASPITAIDEFDKGLDPINKKNLLKQLPVMIEKALELRESDLKEILIPQFLLICPDVAAADVPEGINLLTCIKTAGRSDIRPVTGAAV